MIFVVGLIIGMSLGMLVVGFLAIGAYDRGYEAADAARRTWRAELAARHPHVARERRRLVPGAFPSIAARAG
jgi:hypothetical protein